MASALHDPAPDASLIPAILQHLEEVVSSPAFSRSRRLAEFLRWVVEQEVAGNRAQITERNLALMVYKRGPEFDPRLDGTVRAEAMRLRNKLREHYEGTDAGARRIAIPKGGYAPVFTGFEATAIASKPEPIEAEPLPAPQNQPRILPAAGAVAAIAAVAVLLLIGQPAPPKSKPSPADLASAARLLDRAHSLWRVGENPEARHLLERALALDPANARLHLVYSAVLQNLGYDQRTREEAVRASHLAVASSEADDLAFEARIRFANGDWAAAVRAYRFLLERNPRDFDASVALMQGLALSRDQPGCVDRAARARSLPEGVGNPDLERQAGLCLASMSKNSAALAVVKRGEEYAEAAGLRGSLARLVLLEAGITQNTTGKSLPLLARARALCSELQDEICLVKVSRVSANRMVSSGEFPQAVSLYEEALPVAERLHNDLEMGNLVAGITMALEQMGDLHAADAAYTRYAAISPGVANGYELLPLRAQFAYLRGDLGQSEVLVREAMDHEMHAHTPSVEAADRLLLALIAIQRGELGDAREMLRRAGELVSQYREQGDESSVHTESAMVEAAAGNWGRANEDLDAANRLSAQDATSWFDMRIASLRIHAWRGDYRYILKHAADYGAELEKARCLADAAEARALWSEAEFRAGDAGRARELLHQAQTATTKDSPLLTRLAVLRAAILASRDAPEADRLAEEASQLASRAGFRIELYEARVAREERRMPAAPSEALTKLGSLSAEMDRAGFHGLVDRCRTKSLAQVQGLRP